MILDRFKLDGRTALITGSSGGIGYAIAAGLAGAGARVVLNGREAAKLEAAAQRLRESGARVETACFDVTDGAGVLRAVERIEQAIGPIDILFNNAGMQRRAPLHEFKEADWHQLMATNLDSVFLVGQAVARHMIVRKRGRIINICSVQSELGRPGIAPYTASKGAVKMLTKGMAIDWGPLGLQVNGIGPGYFKTELNQALVDNPEFSQWLINRTPSRRWGELDDLLGAAVFLASDASSFINGHILYVDGGVTATLEDIMDALVIHAARDLRVEDVPTPELQPQQLRIKVRFGGICGSDLHYYQHGGFGTIRVKEPMVLGHEVAGVVEEAGDQVTDFTAGDRVAISPSRPCGACRYCQQGLQNHCLDMRYYGSAMRTPHVQGAFRRELVVETAQAFRLAPQVSDREGAMAEPLAVALHAVRRAGPLLGKSVLVTGCGPIGVLAVIAARRAGASRIVVTDMGEFPLRTALKVGADEAINVATQPEALAAFSADKGEFDVLLEASGNERALRGAFDALRPRGIIVQLGLGGDMTLPINTIVAKEFDLRGTFRFHEEFGIAVDLLNKGLVDVKPLISATVPFRDAGRAFALAADRSQAMKVLLDFE